MTSIILVPLTLWFIYSVVVCTMCHRYGSDFGSASNMAMWVARPLDAFLLSLLTIAMFHHTALGVQVVIEDYVHREGRKLALIYAVKGVCVLLGTACLLSIIKIALGHP